ncbi:hypothetical protein DBR36_03505 [Microbacterium sp. HMWF026]|uniref:hypothetical protein n=1 Tax=Microbacterium sp. HMWF026 TaxID=2056861 RepID=UPI000D39F140|nr:hypothetical protein [Microbacterium sp. HMWF026]PTT21725.1 hypothetical protein DBR36_03505 [Microbacterium sp. HMWF026]
MENLNADFAAFLKSEEARKEPIDTGDWRKRMADDAKKNGDLKADATPNTTLVNKYWDATPDEDSA